MIQVKIKGNLYPAAVNGKMSDKDWDNRESKSITMAGGYADVDPLFVDGMAWSIVQEDSFPVVDEQGEPVLDENGEPVFETRQTEFDNSEFNIRGSLTVHTDGTCTVKMGKPTELEMAYEALSRAVSTAELDAAYMEGVNQA